MRKMFTCLSLALALVSSLNLTARAQEEAVAEAVAVAEPTQSDRTTPTIRPLTVTTGLTDDTQITGTLLDTNSIAVKTAFGEAAIPLSEVAGIRFPSAEDTSTTIVMLNGDSITGATDVKFINVETSWGNAKINGPSVSTMLFVPGLTWKNNEALGGKRWSLAENKPAPAATNPAAPQPSSSGFQQVPNGFQPGRSQGNPQVIFGR